MIEVGDNAQAHALLAEAMEINQRLGHVVNLLADVICTAMLAAAEQRFDLARHLLGAADALSRDLDIPVDPLDRTALERRIAAAPPMAGDVSEAARTEGRRLSLDDVVAEALAWHKG